MKIIQRRKALTVVGALLALAIFAPAAHGARSHIGAPANVMLHPGSHGKRVADLQWLLGGHEPNTFSSVKPTFHWKPNGYFGARTAEAVKQYKWTLGYPGRLIKPLAGPYFFELLTGKAHRPIRWVQLAAARIRAAAVPKLTPLVLRIRLRELSQLGVTEVPLGSNRGYRVEQYQRATGAIGLAWCVSFQQWSFLTAGYGTFAYGTASVYSAVDWAQARGLLRARPKTGALVAFVEYDRYGHRIAGTGHMGFVARSGSGWFVSVEGNQANGVHEIFHHTADRPTVFIYLPGLGLT